MLVCCLAATGSLLLTPIVRRIALRWGAVPRATAMCMLSTRPPRWRRGMRAVALSIIVAHELPTLHSTFADGSEAAGVLAEESSSASGPRRQVRARLADEAGRAGHRGGSMVLVGGIQLAQVPAGITTRSSSERQRRAADDLVHRPDHQRGQLHRGLDGLVAGVTAICARVLLYTYHLAQPNFARPRRHHCWPQRWPAPASGSCRTTSPARIFMGDSGSMFVGLVLAAIATTASTRLDPQALRGLLGQVPLALSLLIPLSVLALPLVDFALAVLRRLRRGHSPFAPDREHLHHRLMEMGHSHRRAVLLLYFWAAVVAFGGVGVSFVRGMWLIVSILAVLVALAILLSMVPRLHLHRH
jgi:UDP-GlcNAc:undecaprenyl-phosphate GlcNAc-1-phosphate transferase